MPHERVASGALVRPLVAPVEIGRPRPIRITSYWLAAVERLGRNRLAVVCGAYVVVLSCLAATAPLITQYVLHDGPADQELSNTFAGPAARHWIGTDNLGRDILARLLFGAQVSLGVALLTVVLVLVLGTLIGVVAGFFGGWVDELLMRAVEVMLAIPGIYLLIMMTTLFPPTILTLALTISFISWMPLARLVRAEMLATRGLDFVTAARASGASDIRMMRIHLLPALVPTIIVTVTNTIGWVILVEAAIDFLGFGVQPPTPSWGNMITVARQFFDQGFLLAIAPGTMIFTSVLAFTLLGNAARDALDPSLKIVVPGSAADSG